MLPSFLYHFRVKPTLNLQSNGWHLRCQSHFHMRRCLLHDLLVHILLYLVHLSPHALLHVLVHWNFQLFRLCGHHVQWHIYRAFLSGLIKSWWMGKVSRPSYKGTWKPWRMWMSVTIYICWLLSSTIYLVTWFGLVDAQPYDLHRVEHHIYPTN